MRATRLLVVLLLVPLTASAATRRHDVEDDELLELAADFPQVGFVLGSCSAILVGPTKVDPTHRREVVDVVTAPDWTAELRSFDVAVVTLDSPIRDVAPAEITGEDPIGRAPARAAPANPPRRGRLISQRWSEP
jgi:hypothetical protein